MKSQATMRIPPRGKEPHAAAPITEAIFEAYHAGTKNFLSPM